MKTTSTLLFLLLLSTFVSLHATNYTNSGNSQNYYLNNGDTLRIVNGLYRGNIYTFTNGSVIIVSSTATFKPNSISTPNGKIINYGICEFGSLGTNSLFAFENFNLLTINGNLNLYTGFTQNWTNNVAATIKITGNFSMDQAVFTNNATMIVGGNFAMYNTTSKYVNRGILNVTGDVSINNGVLENENRIIADDFNAWGGEVINEGSIQPKGDMVFSSGTEYTNECLLVTNEGFSNYGNFTNNGMLWVGRTNTSNDHFLNSGTFTNSKNAVVRTVKFTNYMTINGGGSYYITGDSYASGFIGTWGNTTDTIKVYDVTRSSSSRIFDVQWALIAPNVVYKPFAQPDTNTLNYSGCSVYFRSDLGSALPINWKAFDAKLVQSQALLTWSAEYEANMKFEVEKSTDNNNFVSVATQLSNTTKNYTYTDASVTPNKTVYYRIKATSAINGAVKYTETKTVKLVTASASAIAVYPNPVKAAASIQFTSEKNEQITLRLSNVSGQQILLKNVMVTKGSNVINLTEAAMLHAGVYVVDLINANSIMASQRFIKN